MLPKIDFSYAFAAPHTLALCRPSAGRKMLADIDAQRLRFQYAYGDLKNVPLLAWDAPRIDLETELTLWLDGAALPFAAWRRHDSGAPCLLAEAGDAVHCTLTAIAGETGVIVRTVFENRDTVPHTASTQLASLRGWVVSNLGWIDHIHGDLMLTLNNGRADRVISVAYGAADYPVFRDGRSDTGVPMPDNFRRQTPDGPANTGEGNSMKVCTSLFPLQPGESRTGWLLLPYESYRAEYDALKALDPDRQITDALAEWTALLDSAAQFEVCDAALIRCFRACLADLFVMREPVLGGRCAIAPGTEVYRSINSGEPLGSEMVLDRLGMHEYPASDLWVHFDGQDENGCWAYSKGWEHDCWYIQYYKAAAAMRHYETTGDRDFLERVYQRMYRATLFNHNARQGTKNDPTPAFRGLMPRGMGDAGMMNGGDYYGVFYPANCMTIAADKLTLRAAALLGREEDAALLQQICDEAADALVASLRANSVREDDYEWIPAHAGVENSCLFGCLFAYWPAGILAAEDPLIRGTVRHVQGKKISSGGLPVGTGWLSDGIWAAMALDNFSAAYLRMGKRDEAAAFLYPVLNHASPLVTWCEERGAEAGTPVKSGDMQHLWTPMSVCTYVLDALLYEDEQAIHLCAGIPRHWLAAGQRIRVQGLATSCGPCDFTVETAPDGLRYDVRFVSGAPEKPVILYRRTPETDRPCPLRTLHGVL